jgi:hypothetical protein
MPHTSTIINHSTYLMIIDKWQNIQQWRSYISYFIKGQANSLLYIILIWLMLLQSVGRLNNMSRCSKPPLCLLAFIEDQTCLLGMIHKHTTYFRTMNSAQILQISLINNIWSVPMFKQQLAKTAPLDLDKTAAVLFVIFVPLKP